MTRIMRSVLFGLLLGALFSATMRAATWTAASCNSGDVQKAMNSAGTGDTVVIPAGTCTWTSTISWTPPANVILQGQTTCSGNIPSSCADNTVIIDNVSHSPNDNPMLSITTGSSNQSFRMTGITFKSNGSSSASYNGSIIIYGNSTLVRIDQTHLAITIDGKQMSIKGCVYGVMDHSIVDLSAGTPNNGIFLDQGSCGGDSLGVGNGQWNTATTLGSASFFYFENDTFNGGTNTSGNGSTTAPFVDDCSGGGRFVFRFNTINGATVQGHATGHSNNPPDRSCRAFEVYQNTFGSTSVTSAKDPAFGAFYNTGGTGVWWGNNFTGYYLNVVNGNIDRTSNSTYTQTGTPGGWGYCSSTPIGGVPGPSNWDGNLSGQNGYPCLDQIGRGVGDLLQGSFPNVCDASSTDCKNGIYSGRWPNQTLEPVYEWLDQWSAVPQWPGSVWSQQNAQASPNRDYYLYTLAWNGSSFTGTAFNGTVGTGSGTLAARPSTCIRGVAYWATDQGSWNQSGSGGQGELFVCTTTNTWTVYYTPYTYPHPLVGGGGDPPAPPTDLQAVPQ